MPEEPLLSLVVPGIFFRFTQFAHERRIPAAGLALSKELNISFASIRDRSRPLGHDEQVKPEKPALVVLGDVFQKRYADDINISFAVRCRFILDKRVSFTEGVDLVPHHLLVHVEFTSEVPVATPLLSPEAFMMPSTLTPSYPLCDEDPSCLVQDFLPGPFARPRFLHSDHILTVRLITLHGGIIAFSACSSRSGLADPMSLLSDTVIP